jgi:hypothetical protein
VEGWVNEGPGVSFDEVVIGCAIDNERDLLHVGLPVNLGV